MHYSDYWFYRLDSQTLLGGAFLVPTVSLLHRATSSTISSATSAATAPSTSALATIKGSLQDRDSAS